MYHIRQQPIQPVYVIYKPWPLGLWYQNKPQDHDQKNFAVDKDGQTSNDLGRELYIGVIVCSTMVHARILGHVQSTASDLVPNLPSLPAAHYVSS